MDSSQLPRHLEILAKLIASQNSPQNGSGTEGIWLVTGVWRPGALVLHFGATSGRQGKASSCEFARITEGERKDNKSSSRKSSRRLIFHHQLYLHNGRNAEGNGRDSKLEMYPMHRYFYKVIYIIVF